MATVAPGSGRSSAPRLLLLLLLLLPLPWAPAGVRAVPDEDLSHRNKEPPAPAQQLQPQPAAAQGPEPARAEVSGTHPRARLRRVPGSARAERPPGPRLPAGEGSPAPAPWGRDRWVRFCWSGLASPGSSWGRGAERREGSPLSAFNSGG